MLRAQNPAMVQLARRRFMAAIAAFAPLLLAGRSLAAGNPVAPVEARRMPPLCNCCLDLPPWPSGAALVPPSRGSVPVPPGLFRR